MVYTEQNTKFIDKDGLIYLINQLREDIDNIDASNIDLSNYVTNEQLQEALRNAGVDVDLSSYATKEELLEAINSIDLSSYALKTEIPSIDGLATTEYVDNAIANVPSGGNVDLSNYYTKDETYSKTEVDTAISNIEGGNTSSDSCALYDTVVANGGAIKEYVTTQYTDETYKASYLVENKDELGTIENNGNIYFHFNTNKTTTDLENEFSGLSDFNKQNVFHILASSVPPEEWLSREKMITHSAVYFIGVLNTSSFSDIYLCRYNIDRTWIDDVVSLSTLTNYETGVNQSFCLASHLTYYLCSGALVSEAYDVNKKTYFKCEENNPLWNNGTVFNDETERSRYYLYNRHAMNKHSFDSYIGNFVYVPDNCSCEWGDGTVYNNTITSLEFSKHILDTYVGYNTFTGTKAVNYTMAEWGEKLDNSKGEDGVNGSDGVSPTVYIAETDNGHTVSITDKNGTQSFDVTNGSNGIDGISPTVTVTKEGKVATITCTDVNGTTTATISDGEGGSGGGSSSGGASGITYAYDTEIATGETYFDGRPIYMKIFHIDALSSAPSDYIVYGNYHSQTPFADTLVSAEPIWQSNSNQKRFNGNVIQSFTSASGSSGSAAITAVNRLLKTVAWVQAWQSSSEFAITVTRGQDMYEYGCDVFVKYVKSA